MRRLYFQRFDLWLSLALSFLVSLGTVWLAEQILDKTYLDYVQSHEVADGEIGGVAGADVFRAQNVEDLLAHDTFTVVSPGIQYMNRGAGYFGSWYLYALTLPSGERVAAVINFDSLVRSGEDIYSGETTLPVGRVVYEDLEGSETFLSQIEHSAGPARFLHRYDGLRRPHERGGLPRAAPSGSAAGHDPCLLPGFSPHRFKAWRLPLLLSAAGTKAQKEKRQRSGIGIAPPGLRLPFLPPERRIIF